MTLDQLRYFRAAAKYEHIGRAAESIPISASVVSAAIKQLENELRCVLFVRNKKTIRLTPQGVRLLELSTDLLDKVSGIQAELGKEQIDLSGHYRIGASHFLALKVLTPAWSKLQARFSRLTVDLHSQATWVLIDSILAGRIDFGLGFSPIPHPQLEMEEIFRGRFDVVARKNHPIFKHAIREAYKYLKDYPATMHIATEKILMAQHHPFMKSQHLERNVTFGFDSDFVAFENLRKSNNWCLMLDVVAQNFRKELRSIPFPDDSGAFYTIQIIRHKSKRVDAVMQAAFEGIRSQVKLLKRRNA